MLRRGSCGWAAAPRVLGMVGELPARRKRAARLFFPQPNAGAPEQRRQVVLQQIAVRLDGDVRRRVLSRLRGMRVMTLPRKDGGETFAPDSFHGGEDSNLVVHQDVALRRIAALDILELLLLVDVDQDASLHRLGQARTLDLA